MTYREDPERELRQLREEAHQLREELLYTREALAKAQRALGGVPRWLSIGGLVSAVLSSATFLYLGVAGIRSATAPFSAAAAWALVAALHHRDYLRAPKRDRED